MAQWAVNEKQERNTKSMPRGKKKEEKKGREIIKRQHLNFKQNLSSVALRLKAQASLG